MQRKTERTVERLTGAQRDARRSREGLTAEQVSDMIFRFILDHVLGGAAAMLLYKLGGYDLHEMMCLVLAYMACVMLVLTLRLWVACRIENRRMEQARAEERRRRRRYAA